MITVLTSKTCSYCVKVKNLLKMHDIEFQEWQPDQETLVVFLTPLGLRTVPQVFLQDPRANPDAKRIGGFEDTQAWVNAGKPE